jgi:hypothetical protein
MRVKDYGFCHSPDDHRGLFLPVRLSDCKLHLGTQGIFFLIAKNVITFVYG